jgi:hypothetical protein
MQYADIWPKQQPNETEHDLKQMIVDNVHKNAYIDADWEKDDISNAYRSGNQTEITKGL